MHQSITGLAKKEWEAPVTNGTIEQILYVVSTSRNSVSVNKATLGNRLGQTVWRQCDGLGMGFCTDQRDI